MELVHKLVILSNSSYNLALREASVVAVKVAKSYEDVPLLIVNIFIDRLAFVPVFVWSLLCALCI